MQAQLWSELIASSDDLHYMVFPRLLAVAERAWHKADWESGSDAPLADDWSRFCSVLGHRELPRLDSKRIRYRIPPPGARSSVIRAALSICWALRTSPCPGPNPSVDRRVRWMRDSEKNTIGLRSCVGPPAGKGPRRPAGKK